jgi:hypothetical protein
VPVERLDLEETLAIYLFDAYYEGYNSTLGGEAPMRGRKHTDATKVKIAGNRVYKRGKEHPGYGTKSPWLAERNKLKLYGSPSGENSALAKTYLITQPDGAEVVVRGITQYCRENGLNQGNMCRVARGEQGQHKGYRVKVIKDVQQD